MMFGWIVCSFKGHVERRFKPKVYYSSYSCSRCGEQLHYHNPNPKYPRPGSYERAVRIKNLNMPNSRVLGRVRG